MISSGRGAIPVAAFAALLLACAWPAYKVTAVYSGQISGLFYTGAQAPAPAPVAAHTARVADPKGYDGQFYHFVAHDPLLRLGFSEYVDNARLRWRRIGVPALAAVIGAGNDALTDAAYLAIELGFVFLGAYWLARLTGHPAMAFAFLLIPATLVSLDRMTVDLPLAALVCGVLLYAETPLVYPLLIAAPLVRETGIVLVGAVALHALLSRQPKRALLASATAIPAVLWWAYVHAHTPSDGTPWLTPIPFAGLIRHTLAGGDANPVTSRGLLAAHAAEQLALAGIWLAILLALGMVVSRRRSPGVPEWTALLFVVLFSVIGKADVWDSAYAAGRTLSPLLLTLAVLGWRDRKWILMVPMLLFLPRIALQYQAEAAHGAAAAHAGRNAKITASTMNPNDTM